MKMQEEAEFFRVKEQWRKCQHISDPLHWTAATGDHIVSLLSFCNESYYY